MELHAFRLLKCIKDNENVNYVLKYMKFSVIYYNNIADLYVKHIKYYFNVTKMAFCDIQKAEISFVFFNHFNFLLFYKINYFLPVIINYQ